MAGQALRAIFALLLCASSARAAEYLPPKGAPELLIPGHNVTISVFATQTPVGHGIGIFEKRGDKWYLCGQCVISPETPTMDAAVKSAGGPEAYIDSRRSAINAALARLYPAKKKDAAANAVDDVNKALAGGNTLRIVNGVPQLRDR